MIVSRRTRVQLCRWVSQSACGFVMACALGNSTALADGIEPGLWRVISRAQTGGGIGPPHESSECLTAPEVADLAATFSPDARTVNPSRGSVERKFTGLPTPGRVTRDGQVETHASAE